MKTLTPTPASTITSTTEAANVGSWRLDWCRTAFFLALAGLGIASAVAQQTAPTSLPVVVADFNHDGIPDTLVQSRATPTATIAFGSVPYGTFAGNATAVTFPGLCTFLPQGGIQVGDFNSDGIPDIVFGCDTLIGVLPGKGDGTFGDVITIANSDLNPTMLGNSRNLLVGDFNHDGKLDLVVLTSTIVTPNTSQTVFFVAGGGDGTFSQPVQSSLASGSYTLPVAADLNGDAFPDLVLINAPSNTTPSLDVLGNNQDGTFGAASQGSFTSSASVSISNSAATSILVGNFFGLATTDIVVAGAGGNPDLFAFQNTSTATSFAFNDPVTLPVAAMTGARAGKFTGSGFTDVAVSDGTNITVLTNDGKGNFGATYSTLKLATTTSQFEVADANGDGYADLYTATLPVSGALQLAVNLTSGSSTATSQPFSLPVGTHAVSASWPGNINFTGISASGNQVVVGVPSTTTLASSKNPSLVGDSVTFTAHVAGVGANGQLPSGSVVFMDGTTPLSTAVLNNGGDATISTATLTPGPHTLSAAFAGDTYFAPSSSTVAQVVIALTVSSFTPNTATLGAAATTVVITGTGFVSNSVVQVNGTAIPTTLTNPTTLTAIIPASYFSTVGTLQITVLDPSVSSTSPAVSFTVTAPAPVAILNVPATTQPGSQPVVTLSLSQPYPVAITATVTLSFAASTTPAIDDPNIVFATTGTRTENVAIPAGTTTVPPILLQAGTVAGTITVPIKLTAGGADITPTSLQPGVIVVPAAVPMISTVTATRSGQQLTVVMHGFSNTREMVNAKFHFTPAAGASLDTTDLTIPADSIFNTSWFQTAASDQYGSTFTYTQIFNTSDDATTIGTVDVTLTNTVGESDMKTSQ